MSVCTHLVQSKILHRFVCNPLTSFDDTLYRDLTYAWSLPAHPTFEWKMGLIKAAIDKAAVRPLHENARSHIIYFVGKIREVVRVSDLFVAPKEIY
jgi:hypothetical protein